MNVGVTYVYGSYVSYERTNLSTWYICLQLYANVTHKRYHVSHMRTVVRIRNNLLPMRTFAYNCICM